MDTLIKFDYVVRRIWFKWLNRRRAFSINFWPC